MNPLPLKSSFGVTGSHLFYLPFIFNAKTEKTQKSDKWSEFEFYMLSVVHFSIENSLYMCAIFYDVQIDYIAFKQN